MSASETVLRKVCDVRDYGTALTCAELGVTYLGLHCIETIKPERRGEFVKIARALPTACPAIAIVMVTRATDVGKVANMVSELGPTHVQLHNPVWEPRRIQTLRDQFVQLGLERVKIIGVGTPSQPRDWYEETCRRVDMVIIDRTYYGGPKPAAPLPPKSYVEPVLWVRSRGIPAFIAGGLTTENVRSYVDIARPSGVDVQGGVEVPGQRGTKDPIKLRAFISAVKGFDEPRQSLGDKMI